MNKNIDKAKSILLFQDRYYNAVEISDEAMKAFVRLGFLDKTDDQYLRGLIYNIIGDLYCQPCTVLMKHYRQHSSAVDAFSRIDNKRNIPFGNCRIKLTLA